MTARACDPSPPTKNRQEGWERADLPLQLWADVQAGLEPSLDLYEQLRGLDDSKEQHEVIDAICYRGGAPLAQQLFARATEAIKRGELTPTRTITYTPPSCVVGPDKDLPPIPAVQWVDWEAMQKWLAAEESVSCKTSASTAAVAPARADTGEKDRVQPRLDHDSAA